MRPPVFIGDEASAAGFALAGAAVRVVAPDRAGEALRDSMREAPLVLIGAGAAANISQPQLQAALQSLDPLVLVVPDMISSLPRPDLAAALRRRMGLDG